MDADINKLYESDFYQILDFKCRCKDCGTSKPEYSSSFSISFVRKGNFLFNVFRNSFDSYTGCVLITKPGYERTVTHTHSIPDECTILDFKNDFYEEIKQTYPIVKFLFNNDAHSTLIKTDVAAEVLHNTVLSNVWKRNTERLNMDSIVLEIVENVFGILDNHNQDSQLPSRLKKYHLTTVEIAKEYMLQNYQNDISLTQLAQHCNISPFHFSRIFKKITSYSPHQFLASVRLKNSEMMIKTTTSPIFEIAFQSGFNSVEHFTNSFTQKFGTTPTNYRKLMRL